MIIRSIEKFLGHFENIVSSQNEGFIRILWPNFASFFKFQCSSLFLSNNPIGLSYGRDFFYWRKEPIKADLQNTLNIIEKRIENVLDTLERSFIFKNIAIRRIFNLISRNLCKSKFSTVCQHKNLLKTR